MTYILGIESSCDETAAAIVTDVIADEEKSLPADRILSNVIYSQIEEHKKFQGVLPEVAARAHLDKIDVVVKKALTDAGLELADLDAIAATCGPGLIGGVIVGATFAKTMAMALKIPFIAINHIEAHAISIRLVERIEFPYLLILMSGGHCVSCVVHDINKFEIIGKTLDDSAGESFDKVSKLLGFGYPGGPIIEEKSKLGNADNFQLPRPLCNNHSMDFSFSGLKTAVLLASENCKNQQDKLDLCASFQKTVAEIFAYKLNQALKFCENISINGVVIAGGVAANSCIKNSLLQVCNEHGMKFYFPPKELCTDNGAMIAWLGIEKLQRNQVDKLDFPIAPCWPLGINMFYVQKFY